MSGPSQLHGQKMGGPVLCRYRPQAVDLLRAAGALEPDALVSPSNGGGLLNNWDRETKRLHRLSGTLGWHRHDLRRAVATLLGDLGFAPHVVSVVLGHAHIAEGATAVYARSRYQREHREALQALADEIDRLVRVWFWQCCLGWRRRKYECPAKGSV